MHSEINQYYHLLDVNQHSSLKEIKKAFREKAKLYHPDKNPDKDTQELFINITDAYEFLIRYKKNPTAYSQNTFFEEEQKDTQEKAEQYAKARAEYARRKYEEFKKTDFYKNDQAFLVLLDHLQFFLAILFISAPVIFLCTYFLNSTLLGFSISIALLTLLQKYSRRFYKIDVKNLFQSLKIIFKIKQVKYTISIVLNLFLFFKYALNTQIKVFTFLYVLLLFYCLFFCFSLLKKTTSTFNKNVYFVLIPSLFNLFFVLNYTLSSNQQYEEYSFKHKMEVSGNHVEKTSIILLNNNKYKNYIWFRFFFDFEEMKTKNKITYHFKEGLFGFRILKSYKFNN